MNLNLLKRFDGHNHSMYSNFRLIDSINRPKDLIKTAADLGLSGIALTDHETVAGHIDFLNSEKELKEKNLIPQDFKCACGNEIYLVDNRENIERYWHYILIAKNTDGHKALRELSSIAWYNGFSSRGMMRVPTEKQELERIVKKYPNSLIATNACIGGQLGNRVLALVAAEESGNLDEVFKLKSEIDAFMRWNIDLFGNDFYIEIAAGTSKDQIKFNRRIGSIARCYNRKIVIGSDAHYLTSKERPIHKAYLNSKDGEREVDEFYKDAHLMDNEEAWTNLQKCGVFEEQDFIDMCDASMEIFDKIESYDIFRKPIIPKVDVKNYPTQLFDTGLCSTPILSSLFMSENIQERYWVNECVNTLEKKDLLKVEYLNRLETEAKVIKTIGNKLENCLFEYFNTFQHYIDLFWQCGSIVGPGRGSAVCFLSNYLLGITQINPIQWDLPYWRFLNEDRVELPKL